MLILLGAATILYEALDLSFIKSKQKVRRIDTSTLGCLIKLTILDACHSFLYPQINVCFYSKDNDRSGNWVSLNWVHTHPHLLIFYPFNQIFMTQI